MKNRIYLDHAATTAVHPDVLAEMLPYFGEVGHNPSSLHAEGRRARAGLDAARDRVAAALGVARKEITFVGSGSEADNQAILSAARTYRKRGRHVVSTQIEHHAVLHTLDALRDEGFEITLLPVDERGLVDPAAFANALRDDTVLASVMFANNEIGVMQPIAQLAAAARERGVIFHADAVQGVGLVELRPRDLGVDLLSISAHKFYGPKGVGVLYVRDGLVLLPLVHGGGQEFGRRSGTENVAGIIGLAAALERAVAGRAMRAARIGRLRDRLEAGIRTQAGEVRVNGEGAPRLPNNSNISFAQSIRGVADALGFGGHRSFSRKRVHFGCARTQPRHRRIAHRSALASRRHPVFARRSNDRGRDRPGSGTRASYHRGSKGEGIVSAFDWSIVLDVGVGLGVLLLGVGVFIAGIALARTLGRVDQTLNVIDGQIENLGRPIGETLDHVGGIADTAHQTLARLGGVVGSLEGVAASVSETADLVKGALAPAIVNIGATISG